MRVAVLADAAGLLDTPDTAPDVTIPETVAAVERALGAAGHTVWRVGVARDARWLEALQAAPPDLVFNLCEGAGGEAQFESAVIAALELLGVPHTGSSAWTAALCQRKPAANALLAQAGLPVPPWGVARPGAPLPDVGFPAIVKPAAEDASLGIDQGAVVRDRAALHAKLRLAAEHWDELLVQRFVDGREVNVGVLGGVALPPSEIDFTAMPAGLWRIVSYRAKWDLGSDEDAGAQPVCPARLPAPLADELRTLALAAWSVVGGGGYGRVDFRVDADDRPWLLEVNPNPDLAPDAGLARMARAAGLDYAALVRRVCALAASAAPAGDRPRLNIAAAAGAS